MNKKKILVMTSFGLVPFESVRDQLPKEVVELVDSVINQNTVTPENIEFYINEIAKKKNWEYKKVASYLDNLEKFSPIASFSILLREIAIYLDNQYEDSINKAEEIYAISSLDGKIYKIDKSKAKNFRNFAAFRTIKDAEFAHRVLSKKIRKMFRGCGK